MENKSESKSNRQGQLSKDEEEERNLTEERLANGLSLRKRKINEILSKKRGFERFKNEGQEDYQLTKENINISDEIQNKRYNNPDEFLKDMKKYIQSDNIEFNKFALYYIRIQTISNEATNNKNAFSEMLQKQDFISDILNLIQKYFDNKVIISEGLWIIINILYYQKDSNDLALFLSSQQAIQLYIKILDKKDNNLRMNLYWLLSNLLNNNNITLSNEILFRLYMSPLFRLYIFKDLEDTKFSKLSEMELSYLINIISRLSDFINDTYTQLQKSKDIKKFKDYNSNVDYDSIIENQNYLFNQSITIFIKNVENPNLTTYCIYGLSRLSNFLSDAKIFINLFSSGICRKLVKEIIKVEKDAIIYVIQIMGNFINFAPDELLDSIFLEEIINYFVKLLKENQKEQNLRRDIFWASSNISALNDIKIAEILAKSGLIEEALSSLYNDNDNVVYEIIFFLQGFFDPQNTEVLINYYKKLEYIKHLYTCLKNIYNNTYSGKTYQNDPILEELLTSIGFLFEIGNTFKGENEQNKFIIDFENNGGFDLLETMMNESNFTEKSLACAEELLKYRK